MSTLEITSRIEEIRELENMKKEIEAELEALKDTIKSEMQSRNIDEYKTELFTVRYKEVTTSRFDSKAFKHDFADIYAEYCKPSTSMRFSIA